MVVERVPIREGAFLEGPEGTVLLANRCKSCGQVFFPKAFLCFTCFHEDMDEIRLSQKGSLYSYTIGRMPSTHFQPPYAIGYVDMPEGVRVFAPLKIVEDKPFRTGMDMGVIVDKLWLEDGKEIVGYEFKPL